MDKKEEFKNFVKNNPSLLKYVKNGDMSWQKFYEMYDLYGKDEGVWKDYLVRDAKVVAAAASTVPMFGEFFNWIKQVNLDSIQEGVNNIQRVVGVFQDLGKKEDKPTKQEYKPRPLYKHFDD